MITSLKKEDKFKNPILFPQKRGSRKKKMEERISMKERGKKKKNWRKDKHKTKGQKIKIEWRRYTKSLVSW